MMQWKTSAAISTLTLFFSVFMTRARKIFLPRKLPDWSVQLVSENGSKLQYTGQLLPQITWSQRAMVSPGKSPLLFSFPEVDRDLSSDMSHSTLGDSGLKEAQIYIRFRLRLDMED